MHSKRYDLSRIWDKSLPCILFIMRNPATMCSEKDDRIIKRIRELMETQLPQYGGFYVGNLYPYCSSSDPVLQNSIFDDKHFEQTESENIRKINAMAKDSSLIICAWGDTTIPTPHWLKTVLRSFAKPLYCIGFTKKRQPKLPNLYYKDDLTNLKPFN